MLAAADAEAPAPLADTLDAALLPLITANALGSGVSVDVLDPLTGEHLMSEGLTVPRTPASTAKLLTGAASLNTLDPQRTLATTTVLGAEPGQVVLVGGGDVLLSAGAGSAADVNGRAGLGDLARQTATALLADGQNQVELVLDDKLFSGPTRSSGWSPSDVSGGFVAPIQALAVDAGRVDQGTYAARFDDPAMQAARVFADLLAARGVTVTGNPSRGAAPEDPAELGRVESASISALVEYMLTESDNTVAEVLGRLVAAQAGQPASFAAAGPSVLAAVKDLGVPVEGGVLTDTSGLGDGSLLPAVTLTQLLAIAAGPDGLRLRPLLSGIPVAGVSGTLADRFSEADQSGAVGVVRAKTGTLTGVSALAGTVVDKDGRLLVFAVLADRVTATVPARRALDDLATVLAACGCR